MRRSVEDTLSFLCGAGIGAAMMYLMDPDLGQPRRRYLAERASDALETGGETLGTAWETARERAGRFATYATGATAAGGSYLSEQASDLGHRLRTGTHRMGKGARSYGRSMQRGGQRLVGRFRREPEYTDYIPETTTMITAAAAMVAGMAVMYLLDPQAGRRRRKLIGDKAYSYARRTGDYVDKTGRHLRNKAVGLAHQTGIASSERARERRGSSGLIDKVKNAITGVVGQDKARDIDIDCDEGGCVTLTASFIHDEDRVVDACRRVEGVTGVNVNRSVGAGSTSATAGMGATNTGTGYGAETQSNYGTSGSAGTRNTL